MKILITLEQFLFFVFYCCIMAEDMYLDTVKGIAIIQTKIQKAKFLKPFLYLSLVFLFLMKFLFFICLNVQKTTFKLFNILFF